MKRENNLYQQICSIENLILADARAREGKNYRAIRKFDEHWYENIVALHEALVNKTYKTSPYRTFEITDPKKRLIFCLPYEDRVIQHAVVNIAAPIWMKIFTADSYANIKGKGTHKAYNAVRRAMKDEAGTRYAAQLDIRKFYPSIDHEIMKNIIRRKIKDRDLLELLDGIIDSAEGLPIGNLLSQYFSNLYLAYIDHWIKETLKVKYYFRYADDMLLLAATKEELHEVVGRIRLYLETELKLQLKPNYQVFPITEKRGVDFVGYVIWHKYSFIRKRTKKRYSRRLKKGCGIGTKASYNGLLKHCNSRHLRKKLTTQHEQV